MLIRELTQEKQRIDEIVWFAAIPIITALVAHFAISTAYDFILEGTKNWLNRMAMKGFEPKPGEIPHRTRATVRTGSGKLKTVLYDADEIVTVKGEKVKGSWREVDKNNNLKLNKKGVKLRHTIVDGPMLAAAVKAKRVKFLSQIHLLEMIQNAKIAGYTGPYQLGGTKDSLQDLIKKAHESKSSGFFAKAGRHVRKMFTKRLLVGLQFCLPVYGAVNVLALQRTYIDQVRRGKEEGFKDPLNPKKVYDTTSYDRDIKRLRAATTSFVAIYIISLGPQVLATLTMAFLLTYRKNKLETYAKRALPGAFFLKIWKIIKTTGAVGGIVGTGGILAANVNRDLAYDIGATVSDTLIATNIWTSGETLGETLLRNVAKKLDIIGFDKLMTQLGLSSAAEKTTHDNIKKSKKQDGLSMTTDTPTVDGNTGPRSIISKDAAEKLFGN